ncbi:tetratricopeptide repeat protein [Azospirillum doebereinerae]
MKHRPAPSPRPAAKPSSAPQRLAEGMAHHNAGRLAEAEAAYREILAAAPEQPDALHLMGVIALQVGKPEAAANLIAEAIRLNGRNAVYHSNLGSALRRLGRRAEAAAACRRAVELDASFADAYNNLANVLMDQGDYPEAAEALRRLLAQRPALNEQRLLLGRALILAGRAEEGVDALEELLRRDPRSAAGLTNLGVALRKLDRTGEALAAYRRGLDIAPDDAGLHSNLGSLLNQEGLAEEAMEHFRRAIAAKPDFPDAHVNLSVALRDANRFAESAAAAEEAIRLSPESAEAHTNLSHALLLQGDFERGFSEYEWRFKVPEFPTPPPNVPQPPWTGQPLEGRTVFLHDEQGVGDGIQFARYARTLKAMGARVIVECNRQLLRLFQGLDGADLVIGRQSPPPPFDLHVPMMSVPHRLGTTLDRIPAEVPYLRTEPELTARWRDRLAPVAALRVGIVWAGSPEHRNDHNRSLPLTALAPLGDVPGVRLFSVQKGPGAAQLPQAPMAVEDLGPDIADFADTAAILANLDLLITVDTSVAHLAGALGRPVWVLLPFSPDWRWVMGRDDSPWYPTMRLFRQEAPGDWTPVLTRLRAALAERARK